MGERDEPTEMDEPARGDPRLEIPEALRTPVKRPAMLAEYEKRDRQKGISGQGSAATQASAWAIAMNFVWTLAAALILGFVIQKWVWPASAPWPLLVGMVVGLVLGMMRFIREALKSSRSGR